MVINLLNIKSPMIQTKALFILFFICTGYTCSSQLVKKRGSESEEIIDKNISLQINEI